MRLMHYSLNNMINIIYSKSVLLGSIDPFSVRRRECFIDPLLSCYSS